MGAHKDNPIAHLAARARVGNPEDIRAIVSAVSNVGYGYAFETVIEPNAKKKAEITAFLDAELAAGKKPNEIDTKFDLKPEDQDYVVYHRIQVMRELKAIDQKAVANIRGPEHFRMPLVEVNNRAQQAFEGGPSPIQG